MTKYFAEHIRRQQQPPNPNSDKVIINSADYEGDEVREYICPRDNTILRARKSAQEAFCIRCQDYIDIGSGKTQEVQAIEDPDKDRDSEPCY